MSHCYTLLLFPVVMPVNQKTLQSITTDVICYTHEYTCTHVLLYGHVLCNQHIRINNTFGVFVECRTKLTSGASFSSEAVTKTCHLDGQLLLRQDLVHVHSTQRHLRRSCQAQRRILHTIHLQQGSLLREDKPTLMGAS